MIWRTNYSCAIYIVVVMALSCVSVDLARSQTNAVTSAADDEATKAAIKRGRSKAQGCTRCHGRDGIQRLAKANGWNGPVGLFVVKQLTELRDGVSQHAIMTDIAKGLNDEDISEISAWIQSLADK